MAMELPSVKLNIFKKLEYFQILKEYNKQFDSQFERLRNQKWLEDRKIYSGAYPSWEIEKKILFWSYLYHKFLKRSINRDSLKGIWISREERLSIGVEKIFENLEMRGFGEKGGDSDNPTFTFSKEGLSFGELLWYSYKIKKYKRKNSLKPNSYCEVYKTNYKLSRKSLGYLILQMQVLSLLSFMVYTASFLTFEILNIVGLLDNFKVYIKNYANSNYLVFLIMFPLVLFLISFLMNYFYRFYWVDKKYKSMEKNL